MTRYKATFDGVVPFDDDDIAIYEQDIAKQPELIAEENKAQASTLLQETDWVELGDVADPTNPPYLSNKAAFTAYRAAVRAIAVNPPTTPAEFPPKPDEIWSA